MSKKIGTQTTAKDCQPTLVLPDTLMSGEGVFIDNQTYEKYCIEQRCCKNVQQCLAISEKLKKKDIKGAEQLLDILY